MTISGPADDRVRVLPGRGRTPGRAVGAARRHAADRHPQGVHRAEGVDLPAAPAPAADRRPHGVLRRARCPSSIRSACPATTSARPARRRRRSWRSRWPTGSRTSSWASSAVWTSTRSRPGCRSSSTATSTSSRRSRSSGRRGGSGRGGCAMRYGAQPEPAAMRLRFHTQTAGVLATPRSSPMNNMVRTAIEALAAVLGGHAVAAHERARRGPGAADRGGRRDRAAHAAGDRLRDRRRRT